MKSVWKSLGAGAGLLVALTVAAYLPAMGGGFVFDDAELITDNRLIQARDGLYRFWFTTEAPDYWPLTSTAWWLEWRVWGNKATGYHVANVLLHAVNAVLVWMVVRRLKIPGAWLAALVFAIHPVNVATVAWISEQKNTLSMLFDAVAILLYLKFDEEESLGQRGGRWAWYALSLAAFLLALLSKTSVVMLPVVLLGCAWWRRGRLRWKDFLASAPFFVLALASGLTTIWFQYHRVAGESAGPADGFLSRLATAGWAAWFYLGKALLPVRLMVIYPKWDIDVSRWGSYAPGVLLIGCLVVFWWKRKSWGRPLFFGLGYFVVTLFPVLGFFHQRFHLYSFVADHWLYYSLIGVIAPAAAAAEIVLRRASGQGRYMGMFVVIVVLMLLGVGTWNRSRVYVNEELLWRDNVAKNPNAWVAHYNLGLALGQAGKTEEEMGQYEQALRIKPDYAEAHNNLGNALAQAGKLDVAIGHYERTLAIRPDFAEAHYNLGMALWRSGRAREAMAHWEQALRINPDYTDAQNNLAWQLATIPQAEGGDPVRAVTLARRACELTANRQPTYLDTLAAAYAAAGRLREAIVTAEKAEDVARAAGQSQLIERIEARLQLFRDGHAYRESVGTTGSHISQRE
jgi:tetratricopeptide (TPR) repeat protein